MTAGSLWNYDRHDANENNDAVNYRINHTKATRSKSSEYKTKLIGPAPANTNTLDTEVVIPLKYLSNFLRYLDLPLLEIELHLSWSRKCKISEISGTGAVAANPPNPARELVTMILKDFILISIICHQ